METSIVFPSVATMMDYEARRCVNDNTGLEAFPMSLYTLFFLYSQTVHWPE